MGASAGGWRNWGSVSRLSSRSPSKTATLAAVFRRKHNPSNLRRDVLTPAIDAANERLVKDGIASIEPVTFHSLRRTYASLRCAAGDDVRYTAAQIGHEDPRFTLRAYAQATKRRERLSGPHLRANDRALEWARMGTIAPEEPLPIPAEATKSPV
jgi:integrase